VNADERTVTTDERPVTDMRAWIDDRWRRYRRRQRRRLAAEVTAVVVAFVLLTVSVVLLVWSPSASPPQQPPSIPARIDMPLPFQPTVGALQGAATPPTPDEWAAGTATVVDLTTGRVHTHRGGDPKAWSPDGRRLLIQRDRSLIEVDIETRAQRTVALLDDGWQLAGPGAVGADGRIAVWQRSECRYGYGCDPGYADFTLSFVDAIDGSPVTDDRRFATVRTREPRLLGWQSDGDAVVVLTAAPDFEQPGFEPPQVVALDPGGGRTELITLPQATSRIDIARSLLDRFGAEPPSLADSALDWLAVRGPQAVKLLAIVALLVAARIGYGRWRDRRRRRAVLARIRADRGNGEARAMG
jgi:hypothetical protein